MCYCSHLLIFSCCKELNHTTWLLFHGYKLCVQFSHNQAVKFITPFGSAVHFDDANFHLVIRKITNRKGLIDLLCLKTNNYSALLWLGIFSADVICKMNDSAGNLSNLYPIIRLIKWPTWHSTENNYSRIGIRPNVQGCHMLKG